MIDSKTLMIRSNTAYDVLKYITQIVLPALGTLYFALSQIWGLPYGAEIVGTITAIDAFLGVLLRLSTTAYNKSDEKYDGTVNIIETDEKQLFTLEVEDPYSLDQKEQIVLKIKPQVDHSWDGPAQ